MMPEDLLHGHPASQLFTKNRGDAKCTLNSEAAFPPLDPGQECLVVAASSCKLDEREARFRPQFLQFHLSSPPMTTDINLLPVVIIADPMPVVNRRFAFWHRDRQKYFGGDTMPIGSVGGGVCMTGIGGRVRQLREERGMSQFELGKRSGVDSSYINRLEKGERDNPGVDVVQRLAAALETTMAYLLGETDDPSPLALRGEAAHDKRHIYDPKPELDPDDALDIERTIRLLERLKERSQQSN